MKQSSGMIIRVFLMLALLVSCTVLGQSRRDSGPVLVVAKTIQFEAQQTSVEAVGTAEAIKSVDIYPAAADKVTQVLFSPGQRVNAGDVMLQLDARRQETALQRAKIQLADAKRNLSRLQQSKNQGAVTQSALDDAKSVSDLAEVAVQDAQSDLDDRILVAPFDGYVGLTDIEPGDRITQQTLITTLDDRSSLFINFRAPESAFAVINADSKVSVQPWTNRELALDAQIAQVDTRINEQDRTVRVRAKLPNNDDIYRPGMSFRVNLTTQGQRFAVIPEAGLSWGASGAFVWTIVDGKANKIPVQIKQRLRGRLLVEGPLSENDTLIVEGIQRLRDGQAVTTQAAG